MNTELVELLAQVSILQNLIESGKITPPQYPNRNTLSETEFRSIVSQIQIIGVPLSETVIEDRGEWQPGISRVTKSPLTQNCNNSI
jgi:hypothetical protein